MLYIRNNPNSVYKSPTFRAKISSLVKGEKNPNYNNKWSDEQKKYLSEKQKSSQRYVNENNPTAKQIICLETGEVFDCIKFAMERYQVKHPKSFTVALECHYKTAGGLHWELYNEKLLDDNYRFYRLLIAINDNPHISGLVCIETKEIFKSQSELADKLQITVSKIKWNTTKMGVFKHLNKTYMYIKEFLKSHMVVIPYENLE